MTKEYDVIVEEKKRKSIFAGGDTSKLLNERAAPTRRKDQHPESHVGRVDAYQHPSKVRYRSERERQLLSDSTHRVQPQGDGTLVLTKNVSNLKGRRGTRLRNSATEKNLHQKPQSNDKAGYLTHRNNLFGSNDDVHQSMKGMRHLIKKEEDNVIAQTLSKIRHQVSNLSSLALTPSVSSVAWSRRESLSRPQYKIQKGCQWNQGIHS